MQNIVAENISKEFLKNLEPDLSERRLLDEIGKLSCDELAEALVMWNRARTADLHVSN